MRSLTIVSLLFTATAAAQPNASAEADMLFDRARKLLDEKKIAEACTAFDASQRVSPALSTQINQADCREQNKQYATAYGLWRDVERQTRAPIDEQTKKTNRFALDRVKKLEPRLSKLVIDMASTDRVPGLEITRNGAPYDVILLGQGLPVDGGTYEVSARATDYEAWSTTIDVANDGDTKSVLIPPLVPKPKVAVPGVTSSPTGSVFVAAPPSPPSKIVPYVVGGAGVAMLGVALGLELVARSQYSDAQREPDDLRQEDLWQSAKTKRYVAQGVAVAGLAATGIAVWLYIRARSYEEPMIAPTVEQDGADTRAGLVVRGAF